MSKKTEWKVFSLTALLLSQLGIGSPETINIQGTLSKSGGIPSSGTHSYSIAYYTDKVGGSELGTATGETNVSEVGRFSIRLLPPAAIFSATQVWYELAIDVEDDGLDPDDSFPQRVEIHSVPFAHKVLRQGAGSGLDADFLDGVNSSSFAAASHPHNLANLAGTVTDAQVPNDITIDHASNADQAETAKTAMALSGALADPGDMVPLGDNAFLKVASDGAVEFLVEGSRFRMARQKWFGPKNLLDRISPDEPDAEFPEVGLNNQGEALIVWSQTAGVTTRLYRSQYRNGSWIIPSGPNDAFSPENYFSHNPVVGFSDNGDAIVVWTLADGMIIKAFRSEFRNGQWKDPTGIMDNFNPDGHNVSRMDAAINSSGETIIVWEEFDGMDSQIYKSEYRNGAWTDPTGLSDHIGLVGYDNFDPKVAINDTGDAVIVWVCDNITETRLLRSELRNGEWTHPTDFSDSFSPSGQHANSPEVDINNTGDCLIVWIQSDGTKRQVFRSEYRNGEWHDPSGLSDNISPNEYDINSRAHLALSDSGDAVIVWDQYDGANLKIFRSEYRNGKWIDPNDLSDNISTDDYYWSFPEVVMNKHGEAIIIGSHENGPFGEPGTHVEVFRCEYRDGMWTNPGSPSSIVSLPGTSGYGGKVDLNENGDAVIVWRQSDGSGFHIFRTEYRFGF